jgi:hypothetical protein
MSNTRAHGPIVGIIPGLNYTLFYDMIPDKMSQKITMRELTNPANCNSNKIPHVLRCVEEVARQSVTTDSDEYKQVQTKMPAYAKAYMCEMLDIKESTTDGLVYKIFYSYMVEACDWLTEHELKNIHSMNKKKFHDLIHGIISTFNSDDIQDDNFETVIDKLPAYLHNLFLHYIDMSGNV